ncbi:alpha/beta-hydrolase [Aspergillus crustosus]
MATHNPDDDPRGHTGERFRTDNDSSDTMILPGGRTLGYAQYGLLTGKAVFYLHGLPGSHLEAAGFDTLGLEIGARVIAVDRPGIGWSSPHPGRSLLDHAKDLDQLATHLQLDGYSVLGISGGGPYALSCAFTSPSDKLKCVSIVCGLGPPDIGMKGAGWVHRLGFPLGFRYAPLGLVRWFYKYEGSGRLDLTDEQRLKRLLQRPVGHEKDNDFMRTDWPRLSVQSTRECFKQGFEGVWQDGRLMCTDFGFRIEDIRPGLPVQLWYGKFDTSVPLNHGVQIAARLGERADLRVVDETHASIVVNCMRDVFEALLASS